MASFCLNKAATSNPKEVMVYFKFVTSSCDYDVILEEEEDPNVLDGVTPILIL